jgi:hypothetical protein
MVRRIERVIRPRPIAPVRRPDDARDDAKPRDERSEMDDQPIKPRPRRTPDGPIIDEYLK